MTTVMVFVHLAILIGAIVLGARHGSVGIGAAGGLGVLLLGLTGVHVDRSAIPWDVIGIIMSVIAAIAAMQRAGGMDYLVSVAERILRRNPRRITYYAPLVTYVMTLLAGTGHTSFSTLPVIAEVAKEGGVRPSRPLSAAVVTSQLAITASPISAAVVLMASFVEPLGVSYLQLLAVVIPSTLLAIIPTAVVADHIGRPLDEDPVYRERLAHGLVAPPGRPRDDGGPAARRSVVIVLVAVVAVMVYATLISDQLGLVHDPALGRNEAIITVMLTAATAILVACRVPAADVPDTPVFRSGMSACVCVLGVAWLGTTFINHYLDGITAASGSVLHSAPWLLAVVLFVAASLLYSQAATTQALIPAALSIGVSPLAAVAAFAATSALFVLPTYPTLLAAVEMDDTGSTRIGSWVVNHPFIVPGTVAVVTAVVLGFAIGSVVL